MTLAVETLEKLERRVTISLPMTTIHEEIDKRLKREARNIKAPGFRPGKVPMKIVAAQIGPQVRADVLGSEVSQAFAKVASENALRIAGDPHFTYRKPNSDNDEHAVFDVTFEVFPEVTIGDLANAEVEQATAQVTEADITKTIDVLRKQRVHYHDKGQHSDHGDGGSDFAQEGDRATVDFVGTIDGVEFTGGKADNYAFVLGEGRMLPEFEAATLGLKVGESKTFPLAFPSDYHGKEVAGKTAQFTITLKKLEWAHWPELDAEFAKMLGVDDGNLDKLRTDIKENLEREVANHIRAQTKNNVMEALLKISNFDVPKALVKRNAERLVEMAREDMIRRGLASKKLPENMFPLEIFNSQAEREVRLGLIILEMIKRHQLTATPDQVRARIDELANSYQDPQQVIRHYYNDKNRLNEVEALVSEDNVVKYVLGQAKVTDKQLSFDELMHAKG